jgi:hypothetical protein
MISGTSTETQGQRTLLYNANSKREWTNRIVKDSETRKKWIEKRFG